MTREGSPSGRSDLFQAVPWDPPRSPHGRRREASTARAAPHPPGSRGTKSRGPGALHGPSTLETPGQSFWVIPRATQARASCRCTSAFSQVAAVQTPGSGVASLCLSVLICKTGVVVVLTPTDGGEGSMS